MRVMRAPNKPLPPEDLKVRVISRPADSPLAAVTEASRTRTPSHNGGSAAATPAAQTATRTNRSHNGAPTSTARAAAPPAASEAPAPRAPAPSPAPAPPARAAAVAERKRLLSWGNFGFLLMVVALIAGWFLPTQRYLSPTQGLGYWLGIIGGSLMLLLLVYSARKHFTWLSWLGPTPSWFRFHMVLGILGPLCILYHANFATGAANSNVALFAMLTVAGSGFIGRYLYSHVHNGLYGHKLELTDLQEGAARLREVSGSVGFLPELVARLEAAEKRVLASGPHLSTLGVFKPVVVGASALIARWRLHFYIRHALIASARRSPVIKAEAKRLERAAHAYIDRRLTTTKRVAEFEGYERLFSLWHALHIPLIFMLIIAAVVHVIAVNVY
jgi:hypothetical protein